MYMHVGLKDGWLIVRYYYIHVIIKMISSWIINSKISDNFMFRRL